MIKPLGHIIESINTKRFALISIILAFVLYGNTLQNNYALDDSIVITNNEFTKQGFKGIADILSYDSFTGFFGKEKKLVEGGRYRPLSLITFAIEYRFFGESPQISHFLNIIILITIVLLIYLLVIKLFSLKLGNIFAKKMAIVTALLFLLHPIHTEVVANIKGRDELLSLLFSLLAFLAVLKYFSTKKILNLFLSGVYLFFALMSKENAIAFILIVPLALWFFTKADLKQIVVSSLPLVVGASVFLIIRYNVLGGFHGSVAGELMNNPFMNATEAQKYATILYTWAIYLKLLLFPHPLTFDYYPYHIPLVGFSNPLTIFSIVFIVGISLIAIKGIKKKSVVAFSIIAFAATFSMVSNILFTVGTFMNERFVFMPSLFWCLAISYMAVYYFRKKGYYNKIVIAVAGIYVLSFYPVKTIARNKAWTDDITLFITDVKTSDNSAKSNCSAGGKLWEKGKTIEDIKNSQKIFKQSETYLRQSLKIHPNYVDAWLLLGNLLFDSKTDINESVKCYIEVLKRQTGNINAWNNADIILQKTDNRVLQLSNYTQLQSIDSNRYMINYRLGVLYGRYFNNLQKGIYYLKRANKIDPSKVDALKDLGTAYGFMGMEKEAYNTCKKALKIDNTDAQIYINIGIAASLLGYKKESEKYFAKAKQLKSK